LTPLRQGSTALNVSPNDSTFWSSGSGPRDRDADNPSMPAPLPSMPVPGYADDE
jgi:hypothetical protein